MSEDAREQTKAGVPFPTLAYHLFVEESGAVYYANDIGLRTWHNAGANHNATHISVCYAGDDQPTRAQIEGIGRAIAWCQRQLGRELSISGHKDAPYDTRCPGDPWPGWRQELLDTVARM